VQAGILGTDMKPGQCNDGRREGRGARALDKVVNIDSSTILLLLLLLKLLLLLTLRRARSLRSRWAESEWELSGMR